MEKKRVVILGAGISGLTAAHALLHKHDVVLLEKEARIGGMMQAMHHENFFFEQGPRTFRTHTSPSLHALITQLGLEDQMMGSCQNAKKRFLLFQKHLHEMPTSLWAFHRSPLCKGVVRQLLHEWRQPRKEGDETVYDFVTRRLGVDIAERFFDPMTLGIFGCEARYLSVNSAFPRLKEWETRHGSITAGILRSLVYKRSRKRKHFDAPLFSFKQGTPSLIQALERELEGVLHLQEEVVMLEKQEVFFVQTRAATYEADCIISALPPSVLGKLIQRIAPHAAQLLLSIPMMPMTIVHVGFYGRVLPYKGFGYLIPTKECENLMGVVFDSEIFPAQNCGEQTRLTCMLRGLQGERAIEIVRDALQRHLGIRQTPDVITVVESQEALPLMEVGHKEKIQLIQQELAHALPSLYLVGNYLQHPSVESCIASAQKVANSL